MPTRMHARHRSRQRASLVLVPGSLARASTGFFAAEWRFACLLICTALFFRFGYCMSVGWPGIVARNYFLNGMKKRLVASHRMNASSSRSHCIFTLYVEQQHALFPTKIVSSKLSLVDLYAHRTAPHRTHGEGAAAAWRFSRGADLTCCA